MSSLTEEQRLYIRAELELTEKRLIDQMSNTKIKTKKKKDPLEPKRPGTSFTMFCSDHRAGLKESDPELSFGETAKKLGEMWKSVDENTKAKYDTKCVKEKEKHRVAMESYVKKSKPE
jgi:hypothetical protein